MQIAYTPDGLPVVAARTIEKHLAASPWPCYDRLEEYLQSIGPDIVKPAEDIMAACIRGGGRPEEVPDPFGNRDPYSPRSYDLQATVLAFYDVFSLLRLENNLHVPGQLSDETICRFITENVASEDLMEKQAGLFPARLACENENLLDFQNTRIGEFREYGKRPLGKNCDETMEAVYLGSFAAAYTLAALEENHRTKLATN
ncbi:MAG TPA: hypothetical protein VJK03_02755 [Candidatus Nanoarchaeia archaeon]|nr:hypothetical protein [Candidatus Nanoarchaeia archaeon]